LITKLVESAGSDLGSRWVSALFAPAALFWMLGGLAWSWAVGWDDALDSVEDWVANLSTADAVLVALAGLAVLTVSEQLGRIFTLPLLRLLEGYWPRPIRWLLRPGTGAQRRYRERLDEEFQALAEKVYEQEATAAEERRFAVVDNKLARFPTDPAPTMPTAFGNVMLAAETRPTDRYGIDVVRTWPHLWLVLPEAARTELAASRNNLNTVGTTVGFVGLSALWGAVAWPAVPVALLGSYAVYRAALVPAARHYGDLIEAVVDLYHRELYSALKLRAPRSPAHDRELGSFVTTYLWRGDTRNEHIFVDDEGRS